jgi:hypothetical protein
MERFPPTEVEYRGLVRVFTQISSVVYQYLTPDLIPAWVKGAGVRNFVVREPVRALKEVYSPEARSLSGSVYLLASLRSGRERWLASLERFLAEPRGDPTREPELASKFEPGPSNHKEWLDALVQGPTRNPLSSTQVYHRFSSSDETAYAWLRFLQKSNPHFCAFPSAMFIFNDLDQAMCSQDPSLGEYSCKMYRVNGQIARCIKKGKLVVHNNLVTAIEACQQNFIVGLMTIMGKPAWHANAIIIDRGRGTMTRFEPNGGDAHHVLDRQLNKFVARKLSHVVPNGYVAPSGPVDGIQSLLDVDKFDDYDGVRVEGRWDRGWCAAISLMFIQYRLAYAELEVGHVQEMLLAKRPSTLAMELRSYVNAMVQAVGGTCQSATLVDNSKWAIAGLEKQCPQLENLSLSDQAVLDIAATLEAVDPIMARVQNLFVTQAVPLRDLLLFRQTLTRYPDLHLHIPEVLVPAVDWNVYGELTETAEWHRMHVNVVVVP